jgi:signal transduction histidine kinase
MKFNQTLSRALNVIVVLSVIFILTVAVFFMFRTFQKSTSADIFRYSRELADSVKRTVSTEYRRYMLLVDAGRSVSDFDSEAELRTELERFQDVFGSDGTIPKLILSAGYYMADTPETAREYNFMLGRWVELNNVFNQKPMNRSLEFYFSESETGEMKSYLNVVHSSGDIIIFFNVDRQGFIDSYIKPVLSAANSDFELEWIKIRDLKTIDKILEDERKFPEQYRFHPLKIISGMKEQVFIIVDLPGLAETRRFIVSDKNDSEEESMTSQESKPEYPGMFFTDFFVKLKHSNGAYYYDIEFKAAVSFFETVLIFLIIGILFILMYYQLRRTSMLRSKEKEFVASITHELRTPLTVIRAAADNLSSGIVPPEKLKIYSGLITDQSQRLGNMIEEILIYSKFENRRRKPDNPVTVEFSNLISQFRPTLDAVAAPEGIVLNWDIYGLPNSAETFPDVITLAVNNLVTNAINHAYAGEHRSENIREIRIKFRMLIPDKIQIVVEDDGRGIEPRELKRIFDPFYRDAVSRSRQEKGSGLGLFLTQKKAEVSGGKLTVESPYRRIDGSRPSGSRFTLVLPCLMSKIKESPDG